MNKEYNIIDLLIQLKKWKSELIKATVAIALISVIGSLFLPNYYHAETTFYAASPDLAKPIPIGDDEKDFRIYGDDKDLDRLFTIAISHDVIFFLIDSFDLYEHYDIDKNDKKAKFKVKEELLENYQTIKTKYGALLLIVEDTDPIIAANMANAARERIEQLAQKIVKDSQQKLISTYSENIIIKKVQGDTLGNILINIKEKAGIFDSRSQAGIYTGLLAQSISDLEDAKGKISFYKKYPAYKDSMMKYMAMEVGANYKIAKSTSELEKYAPVITEVRQLEAEQGRLTDQISLDKERLKQLTATFNAPFTALHIVEKADIPVQKSRPSRSILVLITTLVGFMLCCLAVFVIENIKGINLDSKP
jgi:LPS O-antigen subunit length determinant protein (WzzB/FepE family)